MLAKDPKSPHLMEVFIAGIKDPTYPRATALVTEDPIPLKELRAKSAMIVMIYLYMP